MPFFPSALPPPASRSTITFVDGSAEASLSAVRLLEPRRLVPELTDDAVVHAGDTLSFAWSTETDTILSAATLFVRGEDRSYLPAQFSDASVQVIMPALTPGSWDLFVTANVSAAPAGCVGAVSCETVLVREDLLRVTLRL